MALRADEADAALVVTDVTGICRQSRCPEPNYVLSRDVLYCEAFEDSDLSAEANAVIDPRIVVSGTKSALQNIKSKVDRKGEPRRLKDSNTHAA